jgi:hypothetical protein
VHAFRGARVGQTFGEALCDHSVPNSKIARDDQGRRCIACLLMVGDLLAVAQGDALWRAS